MYILKKGGVFLKKISKGKDPRNIKLPDYNDKYYEKETPVQSRAVFLDSFWDGESIDEEKNTKM